MRAFMILLVSALVLGGSLGGAFVGGVALGKSNNEETPAVSFPTPTISSSLQQPDEGGAPSQVSDLHQQLGEGIVPSQVGDLRQRFRSGELTPEELRALRGGRQQLGSGPGGDTSRLGPGARPGVRGTIAKVVGNQVSIETPLGQIQALVGTDTVIRILLEGSLKDLEEGMSVTVNGQPGEDGTIEANTISVAIDNTGG